MPTIKFMYNMDSAMLLGPVTASQYSLFLGIALILFGWIEKKEKLIIYGQVVFILLGGLSLWMLLTNSGITLPENSTSVPKEVRIMSYFRMVAGFSVISLISLLLNLFKSRFHKASLFLIVLLALALFFMVLNILQLPK